MTDALLESPAAQAKILPRIPLRRWGTPQDFEAVAVWLAGPGSAYFTGQTLVCVGVTRRLARPSGAIASSR